MSGSARWTLTGAALVLAIAFLGMARVGDLFEQVTTFVGLFLVASLAYAVAVVLVIRQPLARPATLAGIAAAAVGFRLILLPTTPSLSTDVYRYLWDGRLAASGVSPYRYPPSAPALLDFRDATLYPRLNHLDWHTIYPPGAQLLFWTLARLAPASLGTFKVVILVADLLTMALVLALLRALGRPRSWVLLYAWHPLVVVELAGSGHLDGIVLGLTLMALWAARAGWSGWTGTLVGLATLVKLYPALLLPAVWGRRPGRLLAAWLATVGCGYALYANEGLAVAGSLGRYLTQEDFNGGVRALLEWALAPLGPASRPVARGLSLLALGAVAGWVAVGARRRTTLDRALWLVATYLVTTPNLFPWYALWIVPLAAIRPVWPWLYLSCAVGFAYLTYAHAIWQTPLWLTAVQLGPVGVGLVMTARAPRPERDVGE